MEAEVLKRNLEFDTMLLTDVFLIERLQILQEGNEGKTMRVRGVFQRAGEANSNGRVYPNTVLEGQLGKLQPLIEGRRLCGELDHPTNDTVKLSNASHLITKLEMKGNEVIGEAEILNTPAGLTAKALINGGVKIGISSRGMGTLSESSDGKKIVNEDFNLITFDLVADPSTRGAYPELSESKRSKFINESKAKLEKESNLVKLLKSRFDEAYTQYNEAKKPKMTRKSKKPLIGKQANLDVDRDGQVEGSDLTKLRRMRRKFSKKKMNEGFGQALRGVGAGVRDFLGKTYVGFRDIQGAGRGAAKRSYDDAAAGRPLTFSQFGAPAAAPAAGGAAGGPVVTGGPAAGGGTAPAPAPSPAAAAGGGAPAVSRAAGGGAPAVSRAAPAAAKVANVRQRKTPEDIERLKNSPEAIAKRAARGELNADRVGDPTVAATTPGGRAAARDAIASDQAGRFGRGGDVAKTFNRVKNQIDMTNRVNKQVNPETFIKRSKDAIQKGGRVSIGFDGKPQAAPLVVNSNQNEYVGNILLEMISKYRGYML